MTSADFKPGTHILLDLYGGEGLRDAARLRAVLIEAATRAGATVLSCEIHEFGGAGGVTGVALLAESHISIHTWPEHGFAAVDVFMCGAARPEVAIDHIRSALAAQSHEITTQRRGQRNQ